MKTIAANQKFKDSPVGMIPVDWQYVLLDSLTERGSGHTPDREIPTYWNGGIKWVSLADCDRLDRIFISDTTYNISQDGIENSSATVHPAGVVIVTRDAGVGKSAITTAPMAVSQHFIAWKCGERLHNLFLYYWLQWNKPLLERMAVGSTIKTIGLRFFEKLGLALPIDVQEQRRIADSLKATDDCILNLEQIIAAKTEHKGGLMQQLLSGKRRFTKGISWEYVLLGDAFRERIEIGFNDLPLLAITADKGVVPREELTKRDNSNPDKSKYLRIMPGDIGYNTMRMWQGVSALSSLEGIVSPAYTVVTPTERIDAGFASYLFKFPPTIHVFWRYSQGIVDDTLNLKFDAFSRIRLRIPTSIKEQQRIAAILQTCDHEIALLEKQAEVLREQKRGLMQKLLPGQIRLLPIPA